ncbi:uncharacterized protein LOC124500571 [Dermatophagoides farinae]|uniref:uncharacterized protein LOC124500571 n=1 Tax=Dermatophagoides farinae TaxID=6954 RepID=UPI003F641A7C
MNNDNNNNVNVSRKRFTQLKNPDRIIRKSANTKINETSSRSYGSNGNNCQEKDLIKIVVIGESGSGKSNLIQRLVNDRFDERSPSTIGIDFALFEFESNSLYDSKQNQTYHAQIWDTAGMERYRSSITKIFYRDVNGALLVFDLTRRDHFQALPRWLQEIRSNVHKHQTDHYDDDDDGGGDSDCGGDNGDIPIILVGNKIDLFQAREIDRNEAIKFAQKYHLASYVETSAKNSTNVREAFQQLFGNILEQKQLHYYRQQQKQQQQQQNAAKNSRSKYSTKSKSQQQKSLIHQSSIRLTRDPNYLEQRARNKEKKKSGCSC